MSGRIIEYDIIPNQLGNGKSFRGIIHHTHVLNNEALIGEIVSRNTTVTRQEALAVIDLYEQLIKEHLGKGNTISTGLFRADISMIGQFASRSEKIDYGTHRARVVFRPAKKLNKEVCQGLHFHKRRQARNSNYLTFVTEEGSRLPEGTIRAGGVIRLSGKGLKAYRYENSYELTLSGGGDSYSLRIITTAEANLTALVPPQVPPGEYNLKLVHCYGSVKREFNRDKLRVVAD
ncbi:MAG: hypothetical protein JW874_05800 [Spirochaetales bacterium]|nr:hypothetical protein [Spirochaetales bacterium]